MLQKLHVLVILTNGYEDEIYGDSDAIRTEINGIIFDIFCSYRLEDNNHWELFPYYAYDGILVLGTADESEYDVNLVVNGIESELRCLRTTLGLSNVNYSVTSLITNDPYELALKRYEFTPLIMSHNLTFESTVEQYLQDIPKMRVTLNKAKLLL